MDLELPGKTTPISGVAGVPVINFGPFRYLRIIESLIGVPLIALFLMTFINLLSACYTLLNFVMQESSMTTPASQSQDPDIRSISNVMEVDAWTGERMKKQSEVRGFTIMCDEREPMGDNTAPPPLAYFASSILF